MRYTLPYEIHWCSERYGKSLTVPRGYLSDGATGVRDIWSEAWWLHDFVCDGNPWNDGTPVSTAQEAWILHDKLKEEKRPIRAVAWGIATFCFRSTKKLFKRGKGEGKHG